MMRSRASVPIAENMSANFTTCSMDFRDWALTMFLYLQKYGFVVNSGSWTPPFPRPDRQCSRSPRVLRIVDRPDGEFNFLKSSPSLADIQEGGRSKNRHAFPLAKG